MDSNSTGGLQHKQKRNVEVKHSVIQLLTLELTWTYCFLAVASLLPWPGLGEAPLAFPSCCSFWNWDCYVSSSGGSAHRIVRIASCNPESCKRGVSLQCVFEYALFDARDGGTPYRRGDICKGVGDPVSRPCVGLPSWEASY